jgi:hypothetical protein
VRAIPFEIYGLQQADGLSTLLEDIHMSPLQYSRKAHWRWRRGRCGPGRRCVHGLCFDEKVRVGVWISTYVTAKTIPLT